MSVVPTPLEIFRAKGIPHRRMEDWKYSDLRSVLDAETVARKTRVQWAVKAPPDIERTSIGVDSLPNWAADMLQHHRSAGPMDAAALAFDFHGVALRVPRGVQVAEPIRLDVVSDGQGQVMLLLEQHAAATLLESQIGTGDTFRNLSVLIVLEDGARLTHIREAPPAGELVSIETISVSQARNSQYRMRMTNAGAKLSRTELNVVLAGEGAETDLSGVTVLGDGAHADITTRIDHAVPHTTSRQLFKKVAGGNSRTVYQGKITVREGAIHTDSRQTAKALLLSARAEADLKPELEILADDVKCAHGAAVGDLDADSLFYLRARGIPEAEARGMLVHAFLREVIDGFPEDVRDYATRFVDRGLKAAMESAP